MTNGLEELVTRFYVNITTAPLKRPSFVLDDTIGEQLQLLEAFITDLREHVEPLTAEDEAIVWRLIAERARYRRQREVLGQKRPSKYTVPYHDLTPRQKREFLRLRDEEGF